MLWHWLLSLVPFWFVLHAWKNFTSSIPVPGTTTQCYQHVQTGSIAYTSTSSHPTCIRTSEGRIREIFDSDKRKRLEGHRYAFPGFWDGHGHVLGYGEMLRSVNLYGAESIDGTHTILKTNNLG